jgi:hypothetical protein
LNRLGIAIKSARLPNGAVGSSTGISEVMNRSDTVSGSKVVTQLPHHAADLHGVAIGNAKRSRKSPAVTTGRDSRWVGLPGLRLGPGGFAGA